MTRKPLLYSLFFISGISGLVFEILWVRMLGVQFGTSAPAVATVLAAFMGGLAIGNLLFGPLADRHRRPLALYRKIEIGIAASGLGVSLLLVHGDPVLAWLTRLLSQTGSLQVPLRFLVYVTLLGIPATLMGGTLPVISRALVRAGTQGRVVGLLYAVNTAGAVVGALLPDLALVPMFGLTAAAGLAALGNLSVALGIGYAKVEVAEPDAGAGPAGSLPLAPVALYAVSGLCAMGYEVVWSRVIQHWSQGRITTFSILLAVFLVCLTLGTWGAARIADRVKRPLAWAAGCLLAAGTLALLPVVLAPSLLPLIWDVVPQPEPGWRLEAGHAMLMATVNALYLQSASCLAMGAALPFLAAAAVRGGSVGRATGRLYAANTLAGVLGSALAGFGLLPWLGAQGSLALFCGLAAVVGAAMVARFAIGLAPRLLAPGLALAVVGLGIFLPRGHLTSVCFGVGDDPILEIREGATTTAAVVARHRYGQPLYRELLTPGVSMSDTSFDAQRYMGLMSLVPLLLSEEASQALLICYGVGNSARSLLSHSGLERLDVVDISPEVLSLSPHFASEHGSDPLQDARVQVHVADGRQHLVTTEQRYDVITAEPPPPCDAGVVNLYSREYYALGREKLKAGGVMVQWLPVFQMSPDETRAAVAAFVLEFPHAAMFVGDRYQWFIAGSARPLSVDPARWAALVAQPGLAEELRRLGVYGAGDLLATFLGSDHALRQATTFVRPVTDDYPSLQYPTETLRGWVRFPEEMVEAPEGVLGLVEGGLEALRVAGILDETREALLITRQTRQAVPLLALAEPEAREVAIGNLLRPALALRPADQYSLSLLELDDMSIRPARAHQRAGGGDPHARLTLARLAFYEERWNDTLTLLDGLGDAPSLSQALVQLLQGGALRSLGEIEPARAAFVRSSELSTSEPFRAHALALSKAVAVRFDARLGPLSLPETKSVPGVPSPVE